MNADDRLDQLIRSSLEWQAEQAARRGPSLSQSARAVATRLGPEALQVRPTLSFGPSSDRLLRLILVVVLVLAMIAATIAIGAGLLRDSFQVEPGPFGLPRACAVPMQDGVAIEVRRGTGLVRVYADGVHVRDQSEEGGTFAATIARKVVTERRLSPAGLDRVMAKVADAGLSPGCRTLLTRERFGSIRAALDDGSISLDFGPGGGSALMRQATAGEEAMAESLAASLEHPDAWLPPEAWVDDGARRVVPERWLLVVSLVDTEVPAGSTLTLGGGRTLEGTDPRYGLVALPDGVRPGDFGVGYPSPFSPAPRSSVRCGVISREEALTAATSIDALGIHGDGADTLHNEDVTAEVSFGFEPILHPADSCDARMDLHARAAASPAPEATPHGDQADTDPCSFVSTAAMDVLGATQQRRGWSRHPLGEAAHACHISRPVGEPVVAGAMVSLYPRGLDLGNARRLASSLFGEGLVEEPVDRGLLWTSACPGGSSPCGHAIAAWSGRAFIVIEFETLVFPTSANVTAETARTFALAVLDGLPR